MKKAILLPLILFCAFQLKAQNPYDAIGKKTTMLTLSKGKYPEYHVYDSIQRVGSVILNIKRGTIVKLLERDSLAVVPEVSSRWITPDPLSEEYSSFSPYCYVGNNPIRRIDPDGQDWLDIVAGFAIGVATNVVPGSTGLRNNFTPTDADEYNATLRTVDNTAAVAGAGAMMLGADEMAAGGSVALVGLGASATGIGVAGGVPAMAAGGVVALKGAITSGAGAMLMSNSNANKSAGYDYGKEHGNKLNDKPAEQYSLKDKNGKVQKYGETTRGEDKYGQGNQKRYSKTELEKKGLVYDKEKSGSKKEMHKVQTDKIRDYKKDNNGNRPPLNKTDY